MYRLTHAGFKLEVNDGAVETPRERRITTKAAASTQSPPPDAPMDIADLDVHVAERQPKRRREMEDVEMTAILAQPFSGMTCEICSLLFHADLADNNCIKEGLTDENVKEKTENENASVVNSEGWQPELLKRGKVVYGHKLGQPLPEDAVCEARGCEIRLTADHGMYDIVARTRGKLVRAKWLDDATKLETTFVCKAQATAPLASLREKATANQSFFGVEIPSCSNSQDNILTVVYSSTIKRTVIGPQFVQKKSSIALLF